MRCRGKCCPAVQAARCVVRQPQERRPTLPSSPKQPLTSGWRKKGDVKVWHCGHSSFRVYSAYKLKKQVTGQVKQVLPKTGLLVLGRRKQDHYSQLSASQISRHVYSNTFSDTDLLSHHHSFVWLGDCWKSCHTHTRTHARTFYTVCTAGGKNNESINSSFWQELQISRVIANYWYRGDFYPCFFQGRMTRFKHFRDMTELRLHLKTIS